MKYKPTLLFVLFCVCLSYGASAQDMEVKISTKTETVEGKKFALHTVEKGQTLYSIAKAYGVQKNDIILENPELIDGLKENVQIRIPLPSKNTALTSAPVNTSPDAYQLHKVEQGQTLYSISKLYAVGIDVIELHNPFIKDGLKAGMELRIPRKPVDLPIEKLGNNRKESMDEAGRQINQQALYPPKKQEATVPDSASIKVGVLLPFYLKNNNGTSDSVEVRKEEVYSKSLLALEFYEGLLLAADSLVKSGLSIDLYSFDTENDSTAIQALLQNKKLKEVQLLLGPLYTEELQLVADYAHSNKIPLVSPFSQTNKILLGHELVSKVVASGPMQAATIAEHMLTKQEGANFLLLNSENAKDKSLIDAFKKRFTDKKTASINLNEIFWKKNGGAKSIEPLLKKGIKNVLYCPAIDPALVAELFNKLYQLKEDYELIVYGSDSWASMDNIGASRMMSFQVHLPTSYYVDYENEGTRRVLYLYREKFKTDPSKYALQGFDIGMYYIKHAALKGKDFIIHQQDYPQRGVQTGFNLFQTGVESGWENKQLFILKAEDYQWKNVSE